MKDTVKQQLERIKRRGLKDEAELVELARHGDEQAVGNLYTRHVDTIYRYVLVRVKDPMTAEDLTSQVFLKAVEGLPNYRATGAPFLAWLYRIACARVADYWRHRYRHPEVGLAGPAQDDGPDPSSGLEAEGEWRTAVDLVAQLTDDQQLVVMMRFLGSMSPAEIATALGKTTGAVKAIQHRAMATLARMLKERDV